jgi:hypothetical protein
MVRASCSPVPGLRRVGWMRIHSRRLTLRRAFTFGEAVIVVIVAALAAVLLFGIIFPATSRHRPGHGRTPKDGTQVRGIHQGMILFAGNNKDRFPLPSLLDPENSTVDAPAEAKDTTANIMSVLIYQNFFTPELCVSPSEVNRAIRTDEAFEYSNPSAAVNPAKAVWDPGFNTDFTAPSPKRAAAFSYAHMLPAGNRLASASRNSMNSSDAIIGNRGPTITSVTPGTPPKVAVGFDAKSNTLLIHGSRTTWEGNVAYHDNSVNYETSLAPEGKMWSEKPAADTTGKVFKKWHDVLFFDEPNDPNGTNNFLVNALKSGKEPGEWTFIWD